MNVWFVLFVVADLLVTAGIVLFVMKRRAERGIVVLPAGSGIAELSQLRPLMQFAQERHERIGDYVRANWSGAPEQLPAVLSSLLDQLEGEARAQGRVFSRALLKTVVASSLQQQKVVKGGTVGEALAKVA